MVLPVLASKLPGTSQPEIKALSSKENSETQWESRKELVRRLYIQENRTLEGVISIMETQYDFAATYVLL